MKERSEKLKKPRFGREILQKRTKGERAVYVVVFILCLIYMISMIYPFLWMFVNSLKPFVDYTLDMSAGRAFAFPKTWRFENYSEVFSMIQTADGTNFFSMIFNSVWQALVPIFVGTLTGTWFAYVMSRFRFPGRNILYGVIIFTMTVPVVGNSGAYFKLISDFGVYNSPLFSAVTAVGFGGMGFMVYYGFFKNVPQSYAEAVYIDGGGEFTVFFRIILPQAKPMIIALVINSFIGQWNDYMTPLLYLPSYSTIASGMYLVKNSLIRTGKNPLYYAGLLTTMIPVVAVFFCFSDTIMESMTIGGLKG